MSNHSEGLLLFSASIVFITSSKILLKKWNKLSTEVENKVTVSCPGKILVCGGYLVLDRSYIGITIAADTARFYSTIRSTNNSQTPIVDLNCIHITVKSPQFRSEYRLKYSWNGAEEHLSYCDIETNLFVFRCLELSLLFIRKKIGDANFQKKFREGATNRELLITLQANNDFYSQIAELRKEGLPLKSSSLALLQEFLPCPIVDNVVSVQKTGLGSSAAMVTSFVGALLEWFGVVQLPTATSADASNVGELDRFKEGFELVHNLAQLVHANAQGKIGSGFDVAAAVYGTQIYRRFTGENFLSCMEESVRREDLYSAVACSPDKWDQEVRPLRLPSHIDIVLGDVCGGSSSTAMAKAVLSWRGQRRDEADDLWTRLSAANSAVSQALFALSNLEKLNGLAYRSALITLAKSPSNEWAALQGTVPPSEGAVVECMRDLKLHFGISRSLMRTMGDKAGVAIEPPFQTRIADATEQLAGVICAGVPGAGGCDALFALYIRLPPELTSPTTLANDPVRDNIECLWASWTDRPHADTEDSQVVVCPLKLAAQTGALLGGIRRDCLS